VLIARKYGSAPVSDETQQVADGSSVTSEQQHDMKADMAREEVKTTASTYHEAAASASGTSESSFGEKSHSEAVSAKFTADMEASLGRLKNTLIASFIVTYAQGMSMLQIASKEKNYGLDLSEITRIWRGGCIIRSALLEEMRQAYHREPDLPNLLLDEKFAAVVSANSKDWHSIVGKFSASRVPTMCLSSALAYFEAFRSERLPANLIQAQRDYFGAHTYQRTDKEGVFHTPDWKD
jgi:6-phosphogluconate dehydrogenase